MEPSSRRRRISAVLCVAVLAASLFAGGATAQPTTYTNPVSRDFADTFADPHVIKAKDGYWYAYGTTDPLHEGERRMHTIPISRSTDLVNWTYVGDAFDSPQEVSWAAPDGGLWAPDVRYIDGKYYMYYVVTQTTVTPEQHDNAIGVATSPTPIGPWTDSGAPVVGPRRVGPNNFYWTFDPAQFTDIDGTRYLYFGSYYGGQWVTQLTPDGKRAVGDATQISIGDRYEGAFVIRKGAYYYLFASAANCCAGPTTGYSVYAGRATSPRGPFVDREGVSFLQSRVGGTIVVSMNGNKWIGTGHNSVIQDLSGQDWLVYHAIDRSDPFLDEPYGINERPMLIDRLDWIDGWPTVRAGRWASSGPQPAPITDGAVEDTFDGRSNLGRSWVGRRGWHIAPAGNAETRYAAMRANRRGTTVMRSAAEAPADRRVEADLRSPFRHGGDIGLVSAWQPGAYVVSWLERDRKALVTETIVNRSVTQSRVTPLPDTFVYGTWHNVATHLRDGVLSVEVTDSRLHDPVARHRVTLADRFDQADAVGVATRGGRGYADNISAAKLYQPVTSAAPAPEVGALQPEFSDEFDDATLDAPWTWVRQPAGHQAGGDYVWPTQNADLHTDSNNASVLLRPAPVGDYTVETKLKIDLGTDTVRNYQQAGLIAYEHDDLYAKLVHAAIWNTRQTEFAKEMPFADRISYGGTLVGPPADATWLRLSHRVDPDNGEHEYRAATSRDGESWIWGGVWTMPSTTQPRIGLISLGGAGATAQFEYFRVYSP